MKRFLLFLIFPLFFFLFANIQPASAVTCYTSSGSFEVKNTCFTNNDCADNEYCDYNSAFCLGWGGPCKPLDCTGCSVAENHQCVSQPRSSSTPNCCSYSCIEGGLANSYSASLFDSTCYSPNIDNDINNCGYCGNKCTGGQVCDSGKCACPSDKPNWNPTTKQCEGITPCDPSLYQNSNNCESGGCYWCAPPAYSGYCAASSSDCTSPCTYKADSPKWNDDQCKDSCEYNGCNLRINVCTTGGTCGYSMTSKFCGAGMSCDKGTECYTSTGACGR